MITLRVGLNPVPWGCGDSTAESLFVAAFRALAEAERHSPLEGPVCVRLELARRAPSADGAPVGALVRAVEIAGTGVLWCAVSQIVSEQSWLRASGPKVNPFVSVKVSEVA